MWRQHDEPEETADELGGLVLEALDWIGPEIEQLSNIAESLEDVATEVRARGEVAVEPGSRHAEGIKRIGADAFFELRHTVDRLRAVRETLGRA